MSETLQHINQSWNDNLKLFFQGKYPEKYFSMGRLGPVFQQLGFQPLEIWLTTDTLNRKVDTHTELTEEILADLPLKLNQPLFVFVYYGGEKYNYKKGINVIVPVLTRENKILLIGFRYTSIENQRGKFEVYYVRTLHGREFGSFFAWIKKDLLLFADIKKLEQLSAGATIAPVTEELLQLLKHKYNTKIVNDQIFLPENLKNLSGIEEFTVSEPALAGLEVVKGYEGKTISFGDGNVDKTVADAWKIIHRYHYQVRNLAKKLKGKTLLESAYNIWKFSNRIDKGGHINYHNDDPGVEQLRTPARTWHDRVKGLDCDDFAIWSASLLIEMGYKPDLITVGFDGGDWSHIFVGVNSRVVNNKPVCDVLLDPVMEDKFNFVLQNITKTKIYPMHIEQLSGIPGYELPNKDRPIIDGYTGMAAADDITMTMLGMADEIKQRASLSGMSATKRKQLSKINFLIAHNASLYREPLQLVMPYVDEVLPDGRMVFRSQELASLVDKFLLESHDIIENELSGLDDNELGELMFDDVETMNDVLGDLGRRKHHKHRTHKFWNKVKSKIHNAWQKTKTAVNHAAKTIKKVGGKIAYANKVILLAPVRGGLLTVIRFNVFGLATKLHLGRMSQHEAAQKGIDAVTWQKAHSVYIKAVAMFVKMGGKATALAAALSHGHRKKPLLAKKLVPLQHQIGALGFAVSGAITAAIGAAGKVIKIIGGWFKKAGVKWGDVIKHIHFKRKNKHGKDETVPASPDDIPGDNPEDNSLPAPDMDNSDIRMRRAEADDGSSSTGKTIAIIALGALGLYAISKVV